MSCVEVLGSVNFEKWELFADVEKDVLDKIVIFRVFRFDEAESHCSECCRPEELSCIFVTEEDEVYGIGNNDRGQLGVLDRPASVDEANSDGSQTNSYVFRSPVPIKELSQKGVVSIHSGSNFVLVLCENGSVWGWGLNRTGELTPGGIQLGSYGLTPVSLCLPSSQSADSIVVQQLVLGAAHVLVLDSGGHVYSWGGNGSGQCGVEMYGHFGIPMQLEFGTNTRITRIACGRYHSAAISATGQVFTWGMNQWGELGQDTQSQEVYLPTLVEDFWYNKSSKDYSAGLSQDFEDPVKKAIDVSCGKDHTLVLSDQGKVYTAGYNIYNSLQLDLQHDAVNWFNRLDNLKYRVNSIITSKDSRLSVAVTENGIYTWGLKKGCSVMSRHLAWCASSDGWSSGPTPGAELAELFANCSTPNFRIISPVLRGGCPLFSPRCINVQQFYNNEDLSDVVLNIRGEKLSCHSFILRWRCKHFGGIIFEDSTSVQLRRMSIRIVTVDKYDSFVYKCFIRYLYTWVLNELNGYQLIELWCIAKDYCQDELRCATMRLFSESLTPSNVKLLHNIVLEKKASELEDVIKKYLESENQSGVLRRSKEFDNLTIAEELEEQGIIHESTEPLVQFPEELEERTCEEENVESIIIEKSMNDVEGEILYGSICKLDSESDELHSSYEGFANHQGMFYLHSDNEEDQNYKQIMRTSL